MTRPVKTLTIAMWGLMLAALASLVVSRMIQRPALCREVIAKVPPFSLVDQDGKALTHETLAGKVWACDFVFTRCAGPCPMMSGKMSRIQTALAGTPVRLVTFSVDPAYDTPAVLKTYGKQWSADYSRWTFATGDEKVVQALARALLVGVQPAVADQPIIHSTHFLLVDAKGMVHGPYNGEDDEGWRLLVDDARKLAGK
ncbi:MAG: SCO family protein [Tepidisphaerales bacterium]